MTEPDFWDLIEPAIWRNVSADRSSIMSIAISARRIADALDRLTQCLGKDPFNQVRFRVETMDNAE